MPLGHNPGESGLGGIERNLVGALPADEVKVTLLWIAGSGSDESIVMLWLSPRGINELVRRPSWRASDRDRADLD